MGFKVEGLRFGVQGFCSVLHELYKVLGGSKRAVWGV